MKLKKCQKRTPGKNKCNRLVWNKYFKKGKGKIKKWKSICLTDLKCVAAWNYETDEGPSQKCTFGRPPSYEYEDVNPDDNDCCPCAPGEAATPFCVPPAYPDAGRCDCSFEEYGDYYGEPTR